MAQLGKKICLLALLASIFLSLIPSASLAVSEEECKNYEANENWDQAESCWHDYFGAKKRTLNNEIASKTVEIELTARKIASAQVTIKQLEEEIEKLGDKISSLDVSLDQLSQVLIKRIAETYKKGRIDPLVLFFSSRGFSEFIARYKYLRVIQLHDRKLLLQMETARTNYEGQKNLKEEKQKQLASWKARLEVEKVQLAKAVAAKKVLLTETEQSYQRTIARINAQREALFGGSGFCDPASFKEWPESGDGYQYYFNQADIRWATNIIGTGAFVQSRMCEYGCAVTSMAMVLKKSGIETNPGSLSHESIYDDDLMAWSAVATRFNGSISVLGRQYFGQSNPPPVNWTDIDGALNSGKWVIVFVKNAGHYVVLTHKNGEDYRMHDPLWGPKLSYHSRYDKGSVDQAIIFTR